VPATERIVIDVDPVIKRKLSYIAESTEKTMKDVVCSLIESKCKELGLEEVLGDKRYRIFKIF
jgi:macrodomain Ter protein organizer (MatP/YcbG family)